MHWRENSFRYDKIEVLLCQICVCYSNTYMLHLCKSEITRNRLIGYLALVKLVVVNLETTNRLTGYLVKVHSTTIQHNSDV